MLTHVPVHEEREPNPVFGDALIVGPAKPHGGPYLEVQSVATGLATLYERLRNTLDFRDEHLIRVYAVRRMLKRRLIRGAQADRIVVPLLQELIRGGYISSANVPETSIPEYEAIVTKYIQLFTFLIQTHNGQSDGKLWDWVFLLLANEMDEKLVPVPAQTKLIDSLVGLLEHENMLCNWPLPEEEKRRQTLIAVYRSMLKHNNELISWRLFKEQFPKWREHPTINQIRLAAEQIPGAKADMDHATQMQAADRLARAIKPVTTTLWLLHETMLREDDRGIIIRHAELMKEKLTETVHARYKSTRSRLARALWRSLLYIFLTKMVLALLLEVPADKLLIGAVNWINIGINIAAPVFLLLIFGLSVRIPGEKNTEQIRKIAERLIFEGTTGLEPLRAPRPYRVLLSRFFNSVYAVMYLVTFGAIVSLLLRFDFSFVGILLFLVFLSVVSFFGFRLREQAHELIVTKGQEQFIIFIAVLFFLPILSAGRWIAQQSSKINLFLYFFDLFIEAPLQAFLEFFDKFTGFVREKKDDVTS